MQYCYLKYCKLNLSLFGMSYLHCRIPHGFEQLLDYFDATYVTGTSRSIHRQAASGGVPQLIIRRIPPKFPSSSWNMYDAIIIVQDMTNNLCEAWNRGFSQLIGYNYPSVWTLINALRKESIQTSTAIEQDALGQPPKKASKAFEERPQ